jgi:DNA polymerase-3 subunit epsilon
MKTIQGRNRVYDISQSDCFWSLISRSEKNNKIQNDDIKNIHGVYIFWDWDNKPLRIGKSKNVRNRILSYYSSIRNPKWLFEMLDYIQFVSVIYTYTESESREVEIDLIPKYKPPFNKQDVNSI